MGKPLSRSIDQADGGVLAPVRPRIEDVVVRVQRALSDLSSSQYEEAVRRILDSVDRIQVEHHVVRAADALAAIPLFEARTDSRQTAIAFFSTHYGELIEQGLIFADDLRRHDRRLYRALSVHAANRGQRLSGLVPVRPAAIRRRTAS
ncbi:MAG: hypothetical protein EBR82_13745 [Caulobacteraceae bacterium]|nr:hypothetical protein [Caulobacteraceae bacterium]